MRKETNKIARNEMQEDEIENYGRVAEKIISAHVTKIPTGANPKVTSQNAANNNPTAAVAVAFSHVDVQLRGWY